MREAERWREGYGYCWMEDETYICVCVGGGFVGLKYTHTHTNARTHTAGRLWPGSGQLPVATAGTGVSCQPVTD